MQELLGGKFGEMSTFMNYTFQSLNFRGREQMRPFYDLIANIAAEEFGHIELTPPAAAWILSGKALQILARRSRFSAARLRALRNDVLLAATALVHGAAVMTSDRRDFERIAEVLPVRVVSPSESDG